MILEKILNSVKIWLWESQVSTTSMILKRHCLDYSHLVTRKRNSRFFLICNPNTGNHVRWNDEQLKHTIYYLLPWLIFHLGCCKHGLIFFFYVVVVYVFSHIDLFLFPIFPHWSIPSANNLWRWSRTERTAFKQDLSDKERGRWTRLQEEGHMLFFFKKNTRVLGKEVVVMLTLRFEFPRLKVVPRKVYNDQFWLPFWNKNIRKAKFLESYDLEGSTKSRGQ
jgi:hypothetical protein